VARAREVELDCEAPFFVAAARVVGARAEEVFAQADGILDVKDPERVHDMRVATRRLRAALEIFAPCFPRKRWRKALKRVKAMADALGERRDVDVEIELLEGVAAELVGADREAVERLLDGMREQQRHANNELAAFATAKRLKKLRRRLKKLAGSART
jgi:CHAD domain-containing protein